jgi:hypothetical protein
MTTMQVHKTAVCPTIYGTIYGTGGDALIIYFIFFCAEMEKEESAFVDLELVRTDSTYRT